MITDSSIKLAYVIAHLLSAAFAGGLGYWVAFRTEMRARRLFGVFALVTALWSLVSAAMVAVAAPGVVKIFWRLWRATGLLAAVCLLTFASEFTGRDWRQNPVVRASVVAWGLLSVLGVLAPWHPLSPVTIVYTPFVHAVELRSPHRIAAILSVLVSFVLAYYYFIELYLQSRHRPSSALLVIVGGWTIGIVPFGLSQAGIVLVETYDHTSLGIPVVMASFAYAAFRLDLAEVAPVARDRAIASLSDPFVAVDGRTQLVDFNRATQQLFDLTNRDLGERLDETAPELAQGIAQADESTDTPAEFTIERDGAQRHFDMSVSPIYDPRGDQRGKQVVLRDVTALKQRERQLQRQNDRLDRFAGMVSHDLRNPLQTASGHLQLLEETGDRDRIQDVQDAHQRMEQLIDELLTMARADVVVDDYEPVNIADLARDAWGTAQTEGASLFVDVPGEWTVAGDRDLLRNVFENLFRNAVDHNDRPVSVTAGLLAEGGGFYVADDGVGIPDDEGQQVFEHGHTTSDEGSGFGLAIVSEVVDAHGWNVTVTDSHEGGARFEFHTGAQTRDGASTERAADPVD